MATPQPLPTSPSTRSASVVASEKKTSLNSPPPVIWWMGRTSTPGWSMGTSRNDRPLWRADAGSVRATTKHQCETWASEVQTFWPLMTHSSPSSTALVLTLARSEPASGSL